MAAATFPNRVLEFFTLRETEREIRALPEAVRAPLTRELSRAFQKREAAETLWPRGSMAEALRLARAGLEIAIASLESMPAEGQPRWVAGALVLATGARDQTASAPLSELEREVRPGDEETFRTIVDALIAVEEMAGASLVTPPEIARMRAQRIAITVVAAVLVAALVGWLAHAPMFAKATASAQLAEFGPDNAIDGDPKTLWILPGPTGWLELTLGRARKVSALRVATGNAPWNDRALKDAHIEATLNGAVVKAIDFTFPEPTGPDPLWTSVPFVAPTCDKIRIVVNSSHKLSGGIAEVEVK